MKLLYRSDIHKILLCVLIAIPSLTKSTAQQALPSNTNPFLHNGRIYSFISFKTLGNQYLESPDFMPGTATISGITYPDLLLNYDIYNQQVLLRFRGERDNQTIIIPNEKLSNFTLEKRKFTLIPDETDNPVIYEQIGNGALTLLYHHEKTMELANGEEVHNYEFSKPKKTAYLYSEGTQYKIRRKRDFLRFFEDPQRTEVRKFMRTEKIRFRKANNMQMEKLMNYCNELMK